MKGSFMEKNLVVKSNKLNESRYKLSVQEQRILLSMISMIKPGDIDFKPYSFHIPDFAALVGVTGKNIYSRVKELTKNLVGRRLTIKESDGDLQVSWLSSAKYYDGEGSVDLCFDPKLKPYLLALKKEFSRYQLKNTIRLKSAYSVRIYELLKQYQGIGRRFFELGDLRSILGVQSDIMPLYGNFKARVLEVAKKELVTTDICFDYSPVKTGRSVTGINFFIKENALVVKKSYKKKDNPLGEIIPEVKNTVQDAKNKLLNDKFNSFMDLYPDLYQKLLKQAEKRLSSSKKNKPGFKLLVRFKMLELLPGFLEKSGIKNI